MIYVAQGYEVPTQDTADYDDIALNLLAGEGFVARENWFGFEIRSWRGPFYPLFLAAVYGIFDHSHTVVRVLQCMVGAATVVGLYLIARRLVPRAAIGIGILTAMYGPLVAISHEVLTETWFTFWLVLAVYCLVREKRSAHGDRSAALGGIVIGLATLTRPAGLILLTAYIAHEMLGPRSWRRLSIVLAFVCVVLVPWTIRNYTVHESWPVLSTHGGFILLRSNWQTPDWRRPDGWRIDREVFERIPSELERDRAWSRQAVSFVINHPTVYLRWTVEKFLRFWYVFRPSYNFWFVFILPFFLAGFVRHARETDYRVTSLLIVFSVATFTLVLYGSTRFRLPLEPFFILYAGTWILEYIDRVRIRKAAAFVGAYFAANLLFAANADALRRALLSSLSILNLK